MEYDFANMPCYGMKTKWAASVIADYYDRFMEPLGITGRQFNFLCMLSTVEGCNAREFAKAASVDKSTLARNLKLLMGKGLIVDLKEPNERNSKLFLSPTGRKVFDAAFIQWNAAQNKLKDIFGEAELAIFDRVLAEIGSLNKINP